MVILTAVNQLRVSASKEPLTLAQAEKAMKSWDGGRSAVAFLVEYQPVCDLGKIEFSLNTDVQDK